MPPLHWLPIVPDWRERVRALSSHGSPWNEAVVLANAKLDFVATNRLDHIVRLLFPEPPAGLASQPVRLALLGSSTLTHLHSAIRVGGLRRGLHVSTCETGFGQYLQALTNPRSALHEFRPTVVLVALDAYHLTAGVTAGLTAAETDAALENVKSRIREIWRLATETLGCPIVHQTALPLHTPVLGNNEHRLPGSRARFVARVNEHLPEMADGAGVDLLAVDARAARDGVAQWHNLVFWHHAKQEITVAAAPLYGDMVGRVLAAQQGRTAKCLVLDLDNTLWGGVVGDDGLEGVVIGQGTALGEGFVSFQDYCRELARRGVILAVCSKNDEATALEPFDRHPEMVLRRADIASFVANWSDKASNLRVIAEELGIDLDALVFVDDNPFERNLVRRELPMVAVPELGDDPATYAWSIADAGYFEGLVVTEEDRQRSGQYRTNRVREGLKAPGVDLESYLRELEMRLVWRRFDRIGLQRIVQLINKSNQFNLTTRRYTESEVLAVMSDPTAFGMQLRLLDRFGDNGIVSIIIGRLQADEDLYIDTWLMSCRVLGRQVEPATLNLIAGEARRLGARRLIGEYVPTKKNALVKQHYPRMGFTVVEVDAHGKSRCVLDLARFAPAESCVRVIEG